MNLSKIFEHIESVHFAIDFTVLSGFKVFQRALEENSMVQQLIDDMKRYPTHNNRVLERLIVLLQADHPAEFQHPDDIAISAYLFGLNKADPYLGLNVAEKLSSFHNLWWAHYVAESILETIKTGSVDVDYKVSSPTAFNYMFKTILKSYSSGLAAQYLEGIYDSRRLILFHSASGEISKFVPELSELEAQNRVSASSDAPETLRLEARVA